MAQQWPTEWQPASAKWIAGRAMTLLSHYYHPDQDEAVTEAALGDWVSALSGFSSTQIDRACQKYLHNQPRRRPSPGAIRTMVEEARADKGGSKRDKLTALEREILETRVLPTARRWLGIPGLRHHAVQTLRYWGEEVE